MSLIIEPWAFANYTDNLPAVPANLYGTAVTPGVSNADGTAVTLLSALAFDVHYLVVGFAGFQINTAAAYSLADILIDPAGGTAWKSFIDDLTCGFSGGLTSLVDYTQMYHFPVYIKAGSSVGCQVRTSHTVAPGAGTSRVVAYAYGNPSRPDMWWCGSDVETLGVTAATSTATSVTPGNTGAFGNWATIGTSTARYGAIELGLNGTDATAATLQYYFQVGRNNVQIPGVPTDSTFVTNLEQSFYSKCFGPNWCDIPQGTAIQVRATCSGTAEVFAGGAAIYGVY